MNDTYIVTEEQRRLDLEMAPYDIWGTRAHVVMLARVGVLETGELAAILGALAVLEGRVAEGSYAIDPALGAQLTLEREITLLVGRDSGGKIHTGRSRNDQVSTAQRLWLRDRTLVVHAALCPVIEVLLTLAEAHILTVMPGYTHMQPAKPTTFGQWCLAYTDMLFRDAERLQQTFTRHNLSPLGAAESYGTSWPLDRALTAALLGFDGVQELPLDAIASRGEHEAELLSDLAFVNLHLSKLAQDLLLFNTFEFGMVTLGGNVAQRMGKVTGSSIMPQKKNPDVLELLRANASAVYARLFETLEVLKSLPFGYNRDSRESKATATEGLNRTLAGLNALAGLLATLEVNRERMRQAVLENYSLATDLADFLAQTYGLPYRAAYTSVGKVVNQAIEAGRKLHEIDAAQLVAAVQAETGILVPLTQADLSVVLDPAACLARRRHIGGAAEPEMRRLITTRRARLAELLAWREEREAHIASVRDRVSPRRHGEHGEFQSSR